MLLTETLHLFWEYYQPLLYHFLINQSLEKHMTIIVTKIVNYKWYKTAFILSNINITFAMSWASVLTCLLTMTCYFIRFNIFI